MPLQIIKKWGNSPAVRIPAAVMEAASLRLDQAVQVRAEHGCVIIEPAAPRVHARCLAGRHHAGKPARRGRYRRARGA
ncbi:MAG: hypothetical protein MZV70_44055 [Desulfobacterales bacterium]|nr:hypothetical protein [Desulfobacterales bacterium]